VSDFIHKEFPKSVGRKEFWKQIKRTVNGKEVSEEDIKHIIKQISDHISPNENDHLLDLGCGNAALASNFFSSIGKYTGVDFSEYLLGVAQEFFNPINVEYVYDSAENFINNCSSPKIYTKILIYGVMSYFGRDGLIKILSNIKSDFVSTERIFIGNIPNKLKAQEFYDNRSVKNFNLEDSKSAIGTWWDPEELTQLCYQIGFKVKLLYMPESFYGSKYRFDILLINEK
jgi:cyclopropane fatty-acyl-phospholipid synthase-like methyltransferase